MSNETTLISLAMLKVRIDGGNDYLDYLRPYVLRVLESWDDQIINDATVSEKIKEQLGLAIPSKVVQLSLKRLARDGFLFKENHIWHLRQEVVIPSWASDEATAMRQITFIAKSFVDFARSVGKNISEEDALDCFISFLSNFSVPCIKCFLRNSALPQVPANGDWRTILVSQFVSHIAANSIEKFDSFMVVVQGNMLANALLCPDLSALSSPYCDVTFYFDTAILLSLLGLNGHSKEAAICELLSLIKNLGGKTALFNHTLVEIQSAIEIAAKHIDSSRGRGSIIFTARETGKTKSDLLLIAQKAEDMLKHKGIELHDTPKYINQYQIDEAAFEAMLNEELPNHNKLRAREHDINCLRSIYVLRRGESPVRLEKCKAVFVTSNTPFAQAAQKYSKQLGVSTETSPVITDFSLTNISWLKSPMGAPSLPKKEVLAFSYAALVPSPQFWFKVLDETDRLCDAGEISERDHELMRSSTVAMSELYKLTLGDDNNLSASSIKETLARVINSFIDDEKDKILELENKARELKDKLDESIQQQEDIKQAIYWNTHKKVKKESQLISIAISLVLLILSFIAVFKSDLENENIKIVAYLFTPFLGLASYFVPLKDNTIRDFYFNAFFNKRLAANLKKIGASLE